MHDRSLSDWQHVVNDAPTPTRSPAGEAFTDFVVQVAQLGAAFTDQGERFARLSGQTLARWVILDAVAEDPVTVADIARRRGMARQGVQRLADLLVRDGLAAYEPNPRHRRAKLLRATTAGRAVLDPITRAQVAWANAVGAQIDEGELRQAMGTLERIRTIVDEATCSSGSG
jgi:DNA-binding MarR family transcriptional regulator